MTRPIDLELSTTLTGSDGASYDLLEFIPATTETPEEALIRKQDEGEYQSCIYLSEQPKPVVKPRYTITLKGIKK